MEEASVTRADVAGFGNAIAVPERNYSERYHADVEVCGSIENGHKMQRNEHGDPDNKYRRSKMKALTVILVVGLLFFGISSSIAAGNDLLPSVNYVVDGSRLIVNVIGLPSQEVDETVLKNDDVAVSMETLDEHASVVEETESGFNLTIENVEAILGPSKEGELTFIFKNGTAWTIPFIMAESTQEGAISMNAEIGDQLLNASCPWLKFSHPATGRVTRGYKAKITCGKSPNTYACYHAGFDYSYGDGVVRAVADGKVVRVERMGLNDHGMGNNIIVEHTTADCGKRYSTYSHLESFSSNASVGKRVSRGDKLGFIGGSGYNKSNYWVKHLHFEIKTEAVTSNPSSYKTYRAKSYWGYMPNSNVDAFGYRNPSDWIK